MTKELLLVEIEFRKAVSADAELLIETYNASFYSDYLQYGECPAYGRTSEMMRQSIIDFPKFLIVCSSRPVGCISCKETDKGVYEVGCLGEKQYGAGTGGKEMDYQRENLILHFVTENDLNEVARTWPSDHHPLSDAEARDAIASMRGNYARNTKGSICHLCLAVCEKDNPGIIMGWCGLDGTRDPAEPEIFILLDEPYRNRGYGTQCVRELLRIAAEEYVLSSVHGGCAKENIASARAMEKGGMVRYGAEENGDPLFRFCVDNSSCQEGNTCG